MSPGLLIGLTSAAFFLTAFAAAGIRLLRDFSRHELEEYCRRRRPNRFDQILDGCEQVALGAESLQVLGIALLLVSGGMWTGALVPPRGAAAVAGWAVAFAVGTWLLLVLTSWLPWAVVRIWSVPMLFHTWPLWWTISKLLWPLSIGVNLADAFVRRLVGKPEQEADQEEAFEEEIRTMVTAGHREGLLQQDAREMIEGVIELGDTDVSDIMTPRSNVDALEIGLDWDAVLQFVIRAGRTRIPVYRGNLDNIVGVLFVKDLLAELARPAGEPRRPLEQILRPPWSVPPTKPVDEMLKDFLNTRSHLAIVKDEYQRMAGVVTIEDVLEEIVGEIVDESDKDVEEGIKKVDGTTVDVLGKIHLDELNQRFGLDLPESDDYDTVAGLLLHRLGCIPKAGESVVEGKVRLAVLEASKRRVERVRIEVLDPSNGNLIGASQDAV